MNPTDIEKYADVMELSAFLKLLNFKVTSLDMSDGNTKLEGGVVTTVVLHCGSSGLRIVLERESAACSCPAPADVASGGKETDEEYSSVLRDSSDDEEKNNQFLLDLRQCMNELHEEREERRVKNNGVEVADISLSDIRRSHAKIKTNPPTRYWSLEELMKERYGDADGELPPPRPLLAKQLSTSDTSIVQRTSVKRQSSSFNSIPDNIRGCKTSSPKNYFEKAIAADDILKDFSVLTLGFDVSALKGTEPNQPEIVRGLGSKFAAALRRRLSPNIFRRNIRVYSPNKAEAKNPGLIRYRSAESVDKSTQPSTSKYLK